MTVFLIRFHNDDPSALYQLQAEICGSPTMENVVLQVLKHVH